MFNIGYLIQINFVFDLHQQGVAHEGDLEKHVYLYLPIWPQKLS